VKKLICLFLIFTLSAAARPAIKLTLDPNPNPDYVTCEEWRTQHPEMGTLEGGPTVVPRPAPLTIADKGLIALVVAQDLQSELSADLSQYISDLQARGYRVEQSTYSTAGTAEELRQYFNEKLPYGLVGAVLVGELPAAWYQMIDDWNDNGQIDYDEYGMDYYEEFLCDLFLSDLDGSWHDDSVAAGLMDPMVSGSDGIYDSHTGNRAAEIWVSRIDASHITLLNKTTLYHEYFDRIHDYREAELVLPSKGLFYIDQDWRESFTESEMYRVCKEYEEVRDTMITDATDYEGRIKEEGLYLTVCVHSSPEAHSFHKANSPYPQTFYGWKLTYLEPSYGFYNLFACSNCRWVEQNCMGSLYHFCGKGLASIGSSKTGSMLFFSEFNTPLSTGLSWGQAFKQWTDFWIANHGHSKASRSWFMGMCLLGDGTLDLGEQGPGVTEQKAVIRALALNVIPLARGAVDIRLALPQTEQVHLAVFDASGRLAATLYKGVLEAGEHSLYWNAADAPAGVYFARLVTERSQTAARIVLLK